MYCMLFAVKKNADSQCGTSEFCNPLFSNFYSSSLSLAIRSTNYLWDIQQQSLSHRGECRHDIIIYTENGLRAFREYEGIKLD